MTWEARQPQEVLAVEEGRSPSCCAAVDFGFDFDFGFVAAVSPPVGEAMSAAAFRD
jgi:hypothetical protein